MNDEEERCRKELADAEERYRTSSAELGDALNAIAALLDSVQTLKRVSDRHRETRKRHCMRVGEEWAGPLIVTAPVIAAPVVAVPVVVVPQTVLPPDVEPLPPAPSVDKPLPKEKLAHIRKMIESGDEERFVAWKAAMEASTCILPERYAEARIHTGRATADRRTAVCYGCGKGPELLDYTVGKSYRKMHARCKQHWVGIAKLHAFCNDEQMGQDKQRASSSWFAMREYFKH
jgi:hypothetical protein